MIEKRLGGLWQQLQAKKLHLPHFLSEVRLTGIRGISDLRAAFDYPVTVIAGSNASGKSTVLFAAACAYRVPGAGVKDYVPSTLFPDYRPKTGAREDPRQSAGRGGGPAHGSERALGPGHATERRVRFRLRSTGDHREDQAPQPCRGPGLGHARGLPTHRAQRSKQKGERPAAARGGPREYADPMARRLSRTSRDEPVWTHPPAQRTLGLQAPVV